MEVFLTGRDKRNALGNGMAVYTQLTQEKIAEITQHYGRGQLRLAVGIAEGVENSNYLIESERNGELLRSILTVYEKRVNLADLPFFLQLKKHLAARGVPCPVPLTHADGEMLLPIEGKQAAMISFLPGSSKSLLREGDCAQLGEAMARMHVAADGMPLTRANDLSLAGWRSLYASLIGQLDAIDSGLEAMLGEELAFLQTHWPHDLPQGIIHADLFPNNVFFMDGALSGLIDFYFACQDMLAYDIAICLNCWCFEGEREFNVTKASAMVRAYHAVRPLTAGERAAIPLLARGAALRFLLTRAYDWLHTPKDALVTPLHPMEYVHKLRFFQHARSAAEIGL